VPEKNGGVSRLIVNS